MAGICDQPKEGAEEVGTDFSDPGTVGGIRPNFKNIFQRSNPSHPLLCLGNVGGYPYIGWTLGGFQNRVERRLTIK